MEPNKNGHGQKISACSIAPGPCRINTLSHRVGHRRQAYPEACILHRARCHTKRGLKLIISKVSISSSEPRVATTLALQTQPLLAASFCQDEKLMSAPSTLSKSVASSRTACRMPRRLPLSYFWLLSSSWRPSKSASSATSSNSLFQAPWRARCFGIDSLEWPSSGSASEDATCLCGGCSSLPWPFLGGTLLQLYLFVTFGLPLFHTK